MEETGVESPAGKIRLVAGKSTFFEHAIYWRSSHLVDDAGKPLFMDIPVARAHRSDRARLHFAVDPIGKSHSVHSFATNALSCGENPLWIARVMGIGIPT